MRKFLESKPDIHGGQGFEKVHARLAYWAARTPMIVAIDDGALRLSFEDVAECVQTSAKALQHADAPAVLWIDSTRTPGAQLVEFLGIVASGRVAAVGDPDWPPALKHRVMERLGSPSAAQFSPGGMLPPDSFYIGFTSGSTGLPKGFIRSHRSWTCSFAACVEAFGPVTSTPLLAVGRLSHSLFLFGAVFGLWTGAGVRLQPRFSARNALRTLQENDARSLVAVPSQLILMLEQARLHGHPIIGGTQLIMISGAPWPRTLTPQLQALFPNARIVEFYGTSETSFIAWAESRKDLAAAAVGRPFANVEIRLVPLGGAEEHIARGRGSGLIYVRSPMVFTDYISLEPARGPAQILRDGDWISVGDMGYFDSDGLLHLIGRLERMFVVQGKNLFPEEVEHLLGDHPAVASASVQAVPDAVRGTRAVALLELVEPVSRTTLRNFCRARLEAYKTPHRFYVCDRWPRTLSGKTDHAAVARVLTAYPQVPADWHLLV